MEPSIYEVERTDYVDEIERILDLFNDLAALGPFWVKIRPGGLPEHESFFLKGHG